MEVVSKYGTKEEASALSSIISGRCANDVARAGTRPHVINGIHLVHVLSLDLVLILS